MRSISDFEPEPCLAKVIELFDALVGSDQVLENRQRFGAAFCGHPGQIRYTDYANDIANFNAFTSHVPAG